MGRKMDSLLRRGFRASKFKNLAKLAVTRLAILKNQRQVRSSNARFDVVQLLKLGHQDRALLRVEHVIKEENMLGLFVMMEGFINLLTEKITLLQDNKECPEELEEAISSLIFAATRCGEFPELKHIRETFASRYGKDFDTSASEVRNSCKVHPQMILRLTTRKPTMENRMKMLEEIASENGITLQSNATGSNVYQLVTRSPEKQDLEPEEKQRTLQEPPTDLYKLEAEEEINILVARLSESIKAKKFGGVADAAQEAFEAAAHAAAAARAAVELSRTDSDSGDSDQDDQEPTIHDESTQEEIKNSTNDIDQDHQELIIHESTPEVIKNSTNDIDQDHQELIIHESTPEEIKMDSRNGSGSESDDQEEFYSFRNQEVTLYYETEVETEADLAVTVSRNDSDMNTEPNLVSEADNEVTENQKDAPLMQEEVDSEEDSNEIHHQVETMNHRTDMKYRLESTRTFSDFGQRLGSQQSGVDRKLMSVRTTPVLRG